MFGLLRRPRRCLAACALASTRTSGFSLSSSSSSSRTLGRVASLSSMPPPPQANPNSFVLEGKLFEIGEVQTFESGRCKREFVIRTAETYPNDVKFDLWGDKIHLLDYCELDSDVAVNFNVRGNAWGDPPRYFVNLVAWRVKQLTASAPSVEQTPRVVEASPNYDVSPLDGEGGPSSSDSSDDKPARNKSPFSDGNLNF